MPNGKPARSTRRVPKLCRHRSRTGQIRGYVTDPRIGREIYLGVYDSPECGDAYARWRREYLANTSPPISPASSLPVRIDTPRYVADLLEVYLGEARRLYRRVDGRPSTEVMRFQVLTRRVIKLGFGSMPVQTIISSSLSHRLNSSPASARFSAVSARHFRKNSSPSRM